MDLAIILEEIITVVYIEQGVQELTRSFFSQIYVSVDHQLQLHLHLW